MILKTVFTAALMLMGSVIFSHAIDRDILCDGFIPEHLVPDPIPSNSGFDHDGITKEEFEERNGLARKIFNPFAEKFGGKLEVIEYWDKSEINASALKIGSEWKVYMYGGLARVKGMTPDAFTVVLCHELGHLVGGYPYHDGHSGVSGMANEGNSDYYGVFDCFYRLFKDDKEKNEQEEKMATEKVKNLCQNAHKDKTRQQICMRSMAGGLKVWQVIMDALGQDSKDLAIGKKDPAVVSKTDNFHPEPQCRINTTTAGSLCPKTYYKDDVFPTTLEEMDKLTCNANETGQDYMKGSRPQCWFSRNGY